MSETEMPKQWRRLVDRAKTFGGSKAFVASIGAFANTNENTVRRVCMQDEIPLLPGVVQTPEYIMAIFGLSSRGEKVDMGQMDLRRDIWGTYLQAGGRVEALIHPGALLRPPGNLGAAAMRDVLSYTGRLAERHPGVDLRVRQLGTKFAKQAGTWALTYPDGLDGPVIPTVTVPGIESILPIGEDGVEVMEKTWDIVSENAHDAATTLQMIGEAIDALPPEQLQPS